jgi:hypothetical protein
VGWSVRRLRSRLAIGVTVSAVAGLAGAEVAQARGVWCSPTGDYCMSATVIHGARSIGLRTFAFTGHVRTCVTHRRFTDCRTFHLTTNPRVPDLHQFSARWRRHWPWRGHGTYTVRFRWVEGTTNLGPALSFRA